MDPYLTARSFSTPSYPVRAGGIRSPALCPRRVPDHDRRHHPSADDCFSAALSCGAMDDGAICGRAAHSGRNHGGFPAADFRLAPAQDPYREALYARDFYFLFTWTWYDWLGLHCTARNSRPGSGRRSRAGPRPHLPASASGVIPYGLLSMLAAAVISSSHIFDMYARLQPLRCFHLITFVFLIFLGGVVGEYAAHNRPLGSFPRSALASPHSCFSLSATSTEQVPHIEWPWVRNSSNAWVNTLFWVRHNTPRDAVFAVDSRYFNDDGVDNHGFRAISPPLRAGRLLQGWRRCSDVSRIWPASGSR